MNTITKMLLFVIPAALTPILAILMSGSDPLSARAILSMLISAILNGSVAYKAYYSQSTDAENKQLTH